MLSEAQTVEQYLAELPEERRQVVAKIREVILKNLPKGYREMMGWGMISYGIPLSDYPNTYNGEPLCIAAIASQKNHMSLYLMAVYGDPELERWFRGEYDRRGLKLDMGKSCVRFKKLEDLPLDVIAETIAKVPVADFIRKYEASRKKQ